MRSANRIPAVLPRSAPEIPRRSQPAKFGFPDDEMERLKPRRHVREIERLGTICSEWIAVASIRWVRPPEPRLRVRQIEGGGRIYGEWIAVAYRARASTTSCGPLTR